jgi:hypothetical protein
VDTQDQEDIMARTKPSEYLVVAQDGRLVNRGPAARALLGPGAIWIKVPATRLETGFGMTQETRDGIPLRFKGSVAYRICRPELAALRFDFSEPESGVEGLSRAIQETVLAELRDTVSHLDMQACIEQRKTTLTQAVRAALEALVGPSDEGWGLSLESVQVAQVFIVDEELRRQLEAETRNQIESDSELAGMKAGETVKLARLSSDRRVSQESVETERQKIAREQEIFTLQKDSERVRQEADLKARETVELAQIGSERRVGQERLETERAEIERDRELARLRNAARLDLLEAEAPVQLRQVQDAIELAKARRELLILELETGKLETERELLKERARHEMRMQALPYEQLPSVATAAAGMFQGSTLSLYQGDSNLLAAVDPLVGMIARALSPRGMPGSPEKPAQG